MIPLHINSVETRIPFYIIINWLHEIVPDFVFISRGFQNNSPNEHLLTALTVWLDFGLMQQGSSLMQVYNIKPLFYLGGETVPIKVILIKSCDCQILWNIIWDWALLVHFRVYDFLKLFWVALKEAGAYPQLPTQPKFFYPFQTYTTI